MVATTALAMGIHYPHVRHVILYGDAYGILDFAQMAARAGRDGRRAEVLLYPLSKPMTSAEEDWKRFRSTTDCRRATLSKAVDGEAVSCCSLADAALCDNCQAGYTLVTQGETMEDAVLSNLPGSLDRAQTTDLARVVQALYDALDYLNLGCRYCLLQGRYMPHPPESCPTNLSLLVPSLELALRQCRERTTIPDLMICRFCHMPQQCQIPGVMDRHLTHFQGEKEEPCTLRRSSIGAILALLGSPSHAEKILSVVPRREPGLVLDGIYTLWKQYPCPPNDPARQLPHLVFLLLAAVAESPESPLTVSTVVSQPWFGPWKTRGAHRDLIREIPLPRVPMREVAYVENHLDIFL